ncbi:hypothetical protein [Ralstonia pseudosolanacearum]
MSALLRAAAVSKGHMMRFSPPSKLPWVIGLFAVAAPLAALLAASFSAYRKSWATNALLDLFGVVLIAAAVSFLLIAEVMRQRKSEISENGFFVTEWALTRRLPFVMSVQRRYQWGDIEGIGRSGYTLIFKMRNGCKKVNLFLFDKPEDVAAFAVERWRSQRPDSI